MEIGVSWDRFKEWSGRPIPDVDLGEDNRGKGGTRDLRRLLGELETLVRVVMMVVVVVNYNHHLRLRRIRYCEAEEEYEA